LKTVYLSNSNGNNTVGLFLLALLAILIVWLATSLGIGINPDSTVYIDAARSLLEGHGLFVLTGSGDMKPLTHYPPLYPALLALLTHAGSLLGGVSIETVARVLNSFLFGASVLLVGFTVKDYARNSYWLPVLGALLTLTAPDTVGIHTFALTEGLFIFLSLSGLVSLSRYIQTKRGAWLVVSAAAIAMALLTRYVGIALIFTGVFVLLIVNGRTLRCRCTEALSFGLISCAPMALWAVRNMRLGSGVSDREFVFHPAGLRQIAAGFSTVSTWLLAGKVRTDLRIFFFVVEIVAASLFVYYLRRRRRAQVLVQKNNSDKADPVETLRPRAGSSPLAIILLVFIVSYLGFLIFTASFVDADTVPDARALAPVHVAAIVLVCGLAWKAFEFFRERRVIRTTFVALAIVFVVSYSTRGAIWFIQTRQDGQGYASRAWKESETISRIRNLPAGVPIYSNGYDAIHYLADRPAVYIPEKIKHGTGRDNENYEAEVESMGRALKERSGVLVYFNKFPERWFLPSDAELKEQLKLRGVETNPDGSIYVGTDR
jgi:hypothetical protein